MKYPDSKKRKENGSCSEHAPSVHMNMTGTSWPLLTSQLTAVIAAISILFDAETILTLY